MGGPGKRLERRKWGWTIYSPGSLLAGNAQLVTTLIWRVSPESCSLLVPGMTPFSHSISPVELPNGTALPLTVSLKSAHIGVISSTAELSSDHPDWMRFKQGPGRKGQVHSDWVSIFLVDLKTMSPGLYMYLRCWWNQSTEMNFSCSRYTRCVGIIAQMIKKQINNVILFNRDFWGVGWGGEDWFRIKYKLNIYK